jgi:hypothetical protein
MILVSAICGLPVPAMINDVKIVVPTHGVTYSEMSRWLRIREIQRQSKVLAIVSTWLG